MVVGTRFEPVLDDPFIEDPSAVERIILVSGKFYYELTKGRPEGGMAHKVAVIRIEELCPFPFVRLREVLAQYPNATSVYWAQEEPCNNGPWLHVRGRLMDTMAMNRDPIDLKYLGREISAMPAPGSAELYKQEQAWFVQKVWEPDM